MSKPVSPMEEVSSISSFADVMLAFVEAAKNPQIVEDLKKRLIATVEISEEKRKEAADAAAAITESQRIIALAEKKLSDVEVARGFATKQSEIQKQDIQKALSELDGERATLKTKIDKHMADVDAHKTKADAAQKAIDERNKQLDLRDAALNVRESNVNAGSARLSEREAACVTRETSLGNEEAKLAARKKRLAAMATGDDL